MRGAKRKGPLAMRGAPTLKTTNMKICNLNSFHDGIVHNIILRSSYTRPSSSTCCIVFT